MSNATSPRALSRLSRKTARLNARFARRIGWRRSEVEILDNTVDASKPDFYASVGGRRFDVLTNAKVAEKIAEDLGVTFQHKGGQFCAIAGGCRTEFFPTPNEAFVNFVLITPRKTLRALRASV